MNDKLQVADLQEIHTEDGSTTLVHRKHNVTYKSRDGALSESRWVFCRHLNNYPGLCRVLELGFGTGINFKTTAQYAAKNKRSVHYLSIDHQPIPPDFIHGEDQWSQLIRQALTRCRESNQVATVNHNQIKLSLYPSDWQKTAFTNLQASVIYHDPFSPKVNPQCWTKEYFAWAYRHLSLNGILTTYSAAGHVRRAMAAAGFFVARAQGFGRKREMTVAAKKEVILHGMKIKYKPNQTTDSAFEPPD